MGSCFTVNKKKYINDDEKNKYVNNAIDALHIDILSNNDCKNTSIDKHINFFENKSLSI